jgi:hypothetical protein
MRGTAVESLHLRWDREAAAPADDAADAAVSGSDGCARAQNAVLCAEPVLSEAAVISFTEQQIAGSTGL